MKTLGLLRHAKSDWDDVGQRDFDRGLNDRGRRGARLMGQHILQHAQQWEACLASSAARVRETLAEALPGADVTWDERLYLADPATIIDVVQHHAGDADSVLVCAHNPGLQEMIFALVSEDAENSEFDEAATKYPTAAFAVLELDIDDWADLGKNCGKLAHFKRPRDLDPALGPERV